MSSDTWPFLPLHGERDSSSEETEYSTEKEVPSVRISAALNRRKRLQRLISTAVVILLATWGIIALFLAIFNAAFIPWRQETSRPSDVYRPETLPKDLNRCLCGHTQEEAHSLGCIYDSMAAAWLPTACRDDDLTAKFDRAGPGPDGQWSYYHDEEGTRLITTKAEIADLGPKGGSFWASQEWHAAHCAFYWQKYKRMGATGAVMEERFDTLHHVEHCGKLVLQPRPEYFYLIEVEVRMNGSFDPKPVPDSRVGGKIETPLNLAHDAMGSMGGGHDEIQDNTIRGQSLIEKHVEDDSLLTRIDYSMYIVRNP
ncbi:hypothetical protein F5Y17DRAFT_466210 [Xylariaceae sp. FL0594]|nr:hypothetical protein F5Y17DRAFT_466210 [Xylariaceae sp. FL0594]